MPLIHNMNSEEHGMGYWSVLYLKRPLIIAGIVSLPLFGPSHIALAGEQSDASPQELAKLVFASSSTLLTTMPRPSSSPTHQHGRKPLGL
jgi:hypothetical protein